MISRHITSHDESGMRLLGIGREIYRTPIQTALDEIAVQTVKRARGVIYTQCPCSGGTAILKTYPCGGRMIADCVFFPTASELEQLYVRGPLGDGLFFENAPKLDRPVALPAPDISALIASANYDEFSGAVNALFPDEDMLAEAVCALRRGRMPLALIGDMPSGEFSRKLYFAFELILRALPAGKAAIINYVTMCGSGSPCAGVTALSTNDDGSAFKAYMYLPDGTRDLKVVPSVGDYARAEALLAGSFGDVHAERDADDTILHSAPEIVTGDGFEPLEPDSGLNFEELEPPAPVKPQPAPARVQPVKPAAPAPRPEPAAPAARVPQPAPAAPQPAPAIPQPAPVSAQVGGSELDVAQQMLSASLRYANSHEFRAFTAGFLKLRSSMDSTLYFKYVLKYSDYLHRLDHPMFEVYDAELATLYENPPASLLSAQVALTLMGYPGALRGAVRHVERAGKLDAFIKDAFPRIAPGETACEYALRLIAARRTLLGCTNPKQAQLVTGAMASAASESLAEANHRVTAEGLNDIHAALDSLFSEDDGLSEEAFDHLMSVLIDRIEFKRLDEHSEATYTALNFAYSYIMQWDGQVTDKQRAICLWGRLLKGCSDWNGGVMAGMMRLLSPMNPVNRVDFMSFVRRYFAAMCEGGLDRTQMTESVVMFVMLTALRFDAQNKWRIDQLNDVLDKLNACGEGLEREFWQMINTRVDLLPVDMLNEAHRIAGARSDLALGYTGGSRRASVRRPSADIAPDDGYDADGYDPGSDYPDEDDSYADKDGYAEDEAYSDDEPVPDDGYRGDAGGSGGDEPDIVSTSRRRSRAGEYDSRPVARERQQARPRYDGESGYRVRRGEYESRMSARASEYQAGREPESRSTGTRRRREHSYSYAPGDSSSPDDGHGGRWTGGAGDPVEAESRRVELIHKRADRSRKAAEALVLGSILVVAAGALVFCFIHFLK